MKIAGDARVSPSQAAARRRVRGLLLLMILVAFARLVWHADAKSLWWDESLSLQRAESSLSALVLGQFVFDDGLTQTPIADQHPFVYFLVLGALIRVAGTSDFVLRFPSVAAATLLVPVAWTLARLLVRRKVLPVGAPLWAALLAAVNPFLLWYGREVRMYTLVPLLVLVSSYLLLRWWEVGSERRYLVGYGVSLVLLLATHYLAFLILPVHAAVLFARLAAQNVRRALIVVSALLLGGLAVGWGLTRRILRTPGSGTNFATISLPMMVRDLLNAFSLGLSVDVSRVLWLDAVFAALAILGAAWALRPGRPVAREAWFLPALLIVPVLALQVVQLFQPAYMNARHLSLISGAFVLLVAGGLAVVGRFRWWAGLGLAAVLLAGTGYSTYNYYYSPEYSKDHFAAVGADLRAELQPGDGLLVVPPEMIRLYRHYLPFDLLEPPVRTVAEASGEPTRAWQGLPQPGAPWEVTEARLQTMLGQYRRIWVVASGMMPLSPLQPETRDWLASHAFLARDSGYESNTLLWLKLYLPQPPVLTGLPATVQYPTTVVFGDQVRLSGYDIGQPLTVDSSTPVTLYWQPVQAMARRYKYILRWVRQDDAVAPETLAITEREPYYGMLPTTMWGPGQTIVEYTGLSPVAGGRIGAVRLALQVYDAETLEKLPVTQADRADIADDGYTVLLSDAP